MKRLLLGAIAGAALGINAGSAADFPLRATPERSKASSGLEWTGMYVGAHFGFGLGTLDTGAAAAPDETLLLSGSRLKGWIGGYQAGYNVQLPNGVVLGAEAALTFTDVKRTTNVLEAVERETSTFDSQNDFVPELRARFGYAFGRFLPYLVGGVAWDVNRIKFTYESQPSISQSRTHFGWLLGAGIEFPVTGNWTGRIEYNYLDFAAKTYGSVVLDDEVPAGTRFDPRFHALTVGLNYRIGETSNATQKSEESDAANWSIHGQSTFVEQAYPRFRSPYEGPLSLPGGGQGRETWSATGYVGRRLWDGGEFYINSELLQGFGIGSTNGIAAFPSGEAQKSDFLYPHPGLARLFLRQTFGLGGEQEDVEDGPNQIAGKRDVSRVTVTVGKLAVTDIFDDNAYAHDPRTTFLNWGIWEAGAFDYPADKVGYTWGAVVELNQKHWALRVGYFLEPRVSNTSPLDMHIPERGSYIVELEERYSLFSQPGKLRLIGWVNHANMGSYRETLDNPAFDLEISRTRAPRFKYGLVANLEQTISEELGVFSRLSWNDGRTEIMSFTDMDLSGSLGFVLKGKRWGRPDDKIGVAAEIGALSPDHRDYLAAGGTGILIGDGRLNYQPEKIIEAYYAASLQKWLTLTFDYQFIADPAYNADRGPVSVFATRLHAEF